jgi:predicted dehydrogenase
MADGKATERTELTYGQVGGGPGSLIGPVHRAALAMNDQAELVAGSFSWLYDETLEAAKNLRVSAERAYRTFQEMAERESQRADGIDFAVITTPNHLHYEVAKSFLENGIHVVCDKPLCLTMEEAEHLLELVRETKLEFMVTYTYTGYPMVREARQIIRNGDLGDIRIVVAEYPQAWLAEPVEEKGNMQASWRTSPKYAGVSNSVGDIGTHIENIVHFATGLEIERLSAKLETFVRGRKLDDNAYILLDYSNDASGNYWVSQVAVGNENALRFRVIGTEGSLDWRQEQPDLLLLSRKEKPAMILSKGNDYLNRESRLFARLPPGHPEGYFEAFANLYRDFCGKLVSIKQGRKDEKLFTDVLDGARGVKFVHDCVRSSKQGSEWIDGSFNL